MIVKIENKTVQKIADIVRGTGYEHLVYVVGGFVRDLLMGNEPKDIDLLIDGEIGDGLNFAKWFCKKTGTYVEDKNPILYGLYGTAMFQFDGEKIECVAPRSEKYHEGSRNPVVSSCSIVDDCYRRDFTINSMFIDICSGELFDYSGLGVEDLKDGIIRSTSIPNIIFADDPLRMLRAIRFATRFKFDIDYETFEGLKRHADKIKIIVPERIVDELNKILMCDNPADGFITMENVGLLQYILPELHALNVNEERDGVKHKNVFYHTMDVLNGVAEQGGSLYLRWAALLHDIGKLKTKAFDEKEKKWTFLDHEVVGIKMAAKIFKRLSMPQDARMEFVQKMIRLHMRPIKLVDECVTDSGVRRLLFAAGEDIDDLMKLAYADITTKKEWKKEKFSHAYDMLVQRMHEVEESDHLRDFQPPVNGNEIMERYHLEPCSLVGTLKEKAKEAILDGTIPNEHDAAIAFVDKEYQKISEQL